MRTTATTGAGISAIARLPAIGLIDIGRWFTMLHDSFDPCAQYLQDVTVSPASGILSFPYTFPQTQEGDFYADITLVGAASGFAAGSGITTITIGIGAAPSPGAGKTTINIIPSGGVSFVARLFAGTGISRALPAAGAIGSGDIHIQVACCQEQVKITVNDTVLGVFYAPRYVSQFQPTITLAGTVGSVTLTVNEFSQGIPQPAGKPWSDAQIYGSVGGVNGGNGINHSSSIGINVVDELLLSAIGLRAALPAATSENRIINGRMEIDQPNEGGNQLTATANGIVIDRWRFIQNSATNRLVCSRDTSSPPPGFSASLKMANNGTTTALAAGGLVYVGQQIEGPSIADLLLGTASASPFVLEFWAKANNTGLYPVTVSNAARNRGYMSLFPIDFASNWVRYQFLIPGDTSGTWSSAEGSAGGLAVEFSGGCGSNSQGAANAWGINTLGTSSSVQLATIASSTLNIAGVRVFAGKNWAPGNWRNYAQERELCRRFYRKSFPSGTKPAQSAGIAGSLVVTNPIASGRPSLYAAFDPAMAAAPTVTTFNPSAANANWRDITAAADVAVSVDPTTAIGLTGVHIEVGATVTTLADRLGIHYTADVGF